MEHDDTPLDHLLDDEPAPPATPAALRQVLRRHSRRIAAGGLGALVVVAAGAVTGGYFLGQGGGSAAGLRGTTGNLKVGAAPAGGSPANGAQAKVAAGGGKVAGQGSGSGTAASPPGGTVVSPGAAQQWSHVLTRTTTKGIVLRAYSTPSPTLEPVICNGVVPVGPPRLSSPLSPGSPRSPAASPPACTAACPAATTVEIESSEAAAVGTVMATAPLGTGVPELASAGFGWFGVSEGSPAVVVVARAGVGVATVELRHDGATLDRASPVDRWVALATTGQPPASFSGWQLVALDSSGRQLSSVGVT
ncbi:MAG: hypothetical protein ACRDYD_12450, partial [Acidimicrobiales bacterium]